MKKALVVSSEELKKLIAQHIAKEWVMTTDCSHMTTICGSIIEKLIDQSQIISVMSSNEEQLAEKFPVDCDLGQSLCKQFDVDQIVVYFHERRYLLFFERRLDLKSKGN